MIENIVNKVKGFTRKIVPKSPVATNTDIVPAGVPYPRAAAYLDGVPKGKLLILGNGRPL